MNDLPFENMIYNTGALHFFNETGSCMLKITNSIQAQNLRLCLAAVHY